MTLQKKWFMIEWEEEILRSLGTSEDSKSLNPEALMPRGPELISTIDREMTLGNRCNSLETWHSGRIESMDSLELPKLGVP
jgi:hypothetical protein